MSFRGKVQQSGNVTPGHFVKWVTDGVIADAGSGTPVTNEYETAYFRDQAALLDPRTYIQAVSAGAVVAPGPGKTFYVAQAFLIDGGPNSQGQNGAWFHRNPHYANTIPIGYGTTLQAYLHDGFTVGAAYYSDPSIVTDPDSPDYDERYTIDPIGLYYSRLLRLPTLTLNNTLTRVNAGVAHTSVDEDLDWGGSEALYGIVRHCSCSNGAWVALKGSDANDAFLGMNLNEEISDLHAQRFTNNCVVPFIRKQPGEVGWSGIRMSSGNAAGTNAVTDEINWGVVGWSILPEDW